MNIMRILKPAADEFHSYAHDELGMAAMRLQVRAPGERVSEEEERYRLLPTQLPVRNAVRHCTAGSLLTRCSMSCHPAIISAAHDMSGTAGRFALR